MRLDNVGKGHNLKYKLFLGLVRVLSGGEPAADVLKLLCYRPEMFGKRFCDLTHEALRGPSDWTPGERELFAAFASRLNECRF
jgi:hypothetical protein